MLTCPSDHVCLQCELPSAVLAQIKLAEDVEGSLSHGRHHTRRSDGLSGPVAHCQHSHTQIHTIQAHLDRRQERLYVIYIYMYMYM